MANATAAPKPRQGSLLVGKVTPFNALAGLTALALVLISAPPLIAVLVRVLYRDGKFSTGTITDVLGQPGLAQTLTNTAIVTVASSVIALLVGSALAWLNERTDARMGLLSDALPLVVFVLPPIAGAVGWVLLLSPRAGYLNVLARWALGHFGVHLAQGPFDIYSWGGLILVYAIYQIPFSFMFVSAALRNMDPSLEEASRVSGRGIVGTFLRITLPSLGPALAGALLLTVWTCLENYSIPSVLASGAHINILTVQIVNEVAFTYPARTDIAVGLSLIMVIAVALIWLVQNQITRRARHATVGGKARAATPIPLGRWRLPLRIIVIAIGAVSTILPMCALVLVTLQGYWNPTIHWGRMSLAQYRLQIFDNPTSLLAIKNSLSLGAIGATIAILAAAIVSLFLLRMPGKWAKGLDGAIKLPSTLSPIVLVVGFVIVLAGPPMQLSGTWLILLIAYIALYFPQGSVAADGAASQVSPELAEASAVSGASQSKTFLKIYLPLMAPGLIAGWSFVFVRMVGDLSASAILAGPGNPVVGQQILEVFQNGTFSLMASIALTLTVISAVAVIALTVLSRRVARWSTVSHPSPSRKRKVPR